METLTLDHVGIVVGDLDRASETYRRLGFRLTPRSSHKLRTAPDGPFELLGSGNHCIMFRQGYLELLGVTDPARPHDSIAKRLDRYEGLQLIALGCDNADRVEEVWRQVTDGCEPAVILGRDVPIIDGGTEEGRFKIVYLDDRAVPEAELFAIQHLTPNVLWQDGLLDHPNTATGLLSVSIVSPDSTATTGRLSRLGLSHSAGPHGDRFALASGGWIDVMSEQASAKAFPGARLPALPCAIAARYTVENLAAAEACLDKERIAYERTRVCVRVLPEAAEGCVVDLIQA
jgi:catechol 2,3-dioxygenase-like lactoylglutathione lyase family enzyme